MLGWSGHSVVEDHYCYAATFELAKLFVQLVKLEVQN
jgi:hypothetical protein